MKILANREGLLEAFQAVWGVVPTRSPKPILTNVKLHATADEGTTLVATDLEVGLIRRVLGVKVDRPGSAILSARVLEILRSSRDDEIAIEISEDGDKIEIRGLHSNFKLTSEDPDLYPSVPAFDAADYYRVSAGPLRAAIRRTIFATDPESTRYALGGLLWEIEGETLTVIATDGRRLARCKIALEREGSPPDLLNDGSAKAAPVLPVKAMKMLEKSLSDDDTPVHVAISGKNSASFWCDDVTLYTRLVEGRYPKYQDVFPSEPARRLTMPAGVLLGGIAQAKVMTSEESRGVDFEFTGDKLTLTSQGSDAGAATVELDARLDGGNLGITFDPRYIDSMLRTFPEDQDVTLHLIDARSPTMATVEACGYSYVIMPLTRDR